MEDDDLYPQRAGHGYEAGCECDLEGGDSDCNVQPPYETTEAYCQRLRQTIIELRIALELIGECTACPSCKHRALDALAGGTSKRKQVTP